MKVVLDEGAHIPEKAHRADAGYDLRTPKRVVLRRHESVCIDTGVHVQIPDGWFGQMFSKSGLHVKHDIVSLGGTVDSHYTGSIVVKLYNLGNEDYVFEAGDKIVQIVFMPCGSFSLTQVDELEETERGDRGFGSSGK
ncbi:dUTP diphosphatase [Bilifractor sp. LCP21S3_A7]|uniref:dUTP diphosphatase n=3 Tax=unclassified Bilifractor TaxID=2815795 RepID=UPI003F908EA0